MIEEAGNGGTEYVGKTYRENEAGVLVAVPSPRVELLLGCGNNRAKQMHLQGHEEWEGLVTVDIGQDCKPDVVWDLENIPLPFPENYADEIHAYAVLEHTGRQGDWRQFFAQFSDFWRILKPEGVMFVITSSWNSIQTWGDPAHSRIINSVTLAFLSQKMYATQVGKTMMTDYREWYHADFDVIHVDESMDGLFGFAIRAIKGDDSREAA
jgi:hypothetical protein